MQLPAEHGWGVVLVLVLVLVVVLVEHIGVQGVIATSQASRPLCEGGQHGHVDGQGFDCRTQLWPFHCQRQEASHGESVVLVVDPGGGGGMSGLPQVV